MQFNRSPDVRLSSTRGGRKDAIKQSLSTPISNQSMHISGQSVPLQDSDVLLVLMIEIGPGLYDKLMVRKGSHLEELAQSFRKKHSLPTKIIKPLIEYIEMNLSDSMKEQVYGTITKQDPKDPKSMNMIRDPKALRDPKNPRDLRYVASAFEQRFDDANESSFNMRSPNLTNPYISQKGIPHSGRSFNRDFNETPGRLFSPDLSTQSKSPTLSSTVGNTPRKTTPQEGYSHIQPGNIYNDNAIDPSTRSPYSQVGQFQFDPIASPELQNESTNDSRTWIAQQKALLQEYHNVIQKYRNDFENRMSFVAGCEDRINTQEKKLQLQADMIETLKSEVSALRKKCDDLQTDSINNMNIVSSLRKKCQTQQIIIEGLEADVLDLQKQNLNLLATRRPTFSDLYSSQTSEVFSKPNSLPQYMSPDVRNYLMSESDELPQDALNPQSTSKTSTISTPVSPENNSYSNSMEAKNIIDTMSKLESIKESIAVERKLVDTTTLLQPTTEAINPNKSEISEVQVEDNFSSLNQSMKPIIDGLVKNTQMIHDDSLNFSAYNDSITNVSNSMSNGTTDNCVEKCTPNASVQRQESDISLNCESLKKLSDRVLKSSENHESLKLKEEPSMTVGATLSSEKAIQDIQIHDNVKTNISLDNEGRDITPHQHQVFEAPVSQDISTICKDIVHGDNVKSTMMREENIIETPKEIPLPPFPILKEPSEALVKLLARNYPLETQNVNIMSPTSINTPSEQISNFPNEDNIERHSPNKSILLDTHHEGRTTEEALVTLPEMGKQTSSELSHTETDNDSTLQNVNEAAEKKFDPIHDEGVQFSSAIQMALKKMEERKQDRMKRLQEREAKWEQEMKEFTGKQFS